MAPSLLRHSMDKISDHHSFGILLVAARSICYKQTAIALCLPRYRPASLIITIASFPYIPECRWIDVLVNSKRNLDPARIIATSSIVIHAS